MFDIGRLKNGETVVISGAAGSVGLVSHAPALASLNPIDPLRQIATQIALAHPRCRVVAIAGSDDKCRSLRSLGCHDVLNYKDEGFRKAFRNIGLIDVYFDNGAFIYTSPCDVLNMFSSGRRDPRFRAGATQALRADSRLRRDLRVQVS